MFSIDQDITVPKLREKNLVKVFFSMNNHQIATPEMMLEEACSYVMFYSEPGGKVSAYIGLYLLLTGRRLFYAHSSNPFPPRELDSVEDEALCFVEGLGALLDQIDIAKLSAEEKSRWLDEQDIFSLQARPGKAPETPAPEPAETEAVRAEPQVLQSSFAVTEIEPQPQRPPVQSEPQAEPAHFAPEAAPAAMQTQTAPQPVLQAALAAPDLPAPPTKEALSEREEQSTPQPSAAQPHGDPEEVYQEQAAPSPADVTETGNALTTQQASDGTSPRETPGPAPDGTRPKPAVRATGSKDAPTAASSMGKQDVMRKAIKAGVVRPSKPSIKKEAEYDTGVVRRDREALARLLTSF